jgi:6-phosphogluconolactonase
LVFASCQKEKPVILKLNIFKEPEDVIEGLAEYFVAIAQQSIASGQRFSVALSGGSSPKKLYEKLASVYKDKLDWTKVYFFFGDERYVAQTDANSNYLMAKNALFQPLSIAQTQIFAVDTSAEPDVAAQKYYQVIKGFFNGQENSFDLVLLGLGDNSHTASLFPDTDVLDDTEPSVKEVFLNDQKVYRITLNAPLINQARHTAFLVYGKEKAEAVHHVIEDQKDIKHFPAQLIKPVNEELQWFLDESAASRITKPSV